MCGATMVERLGIWLRGYANRDGRGYPDWAMRYMPIVKRLRRRALQRERVLEIGANENGFSRFANVPVVAVDIDSENLRACRREQRALPIMADVAALPFRDGTFDVCVCIDTFEHLPQPTRGRAASEIARVVQVAGTAVVAFPSGGAAVRAERKIRDEYYRATGNRLRWLEEHDEMGLPSTDDVVASFRSSMRGSHRVSRAKNTNLTVWRWAWRVMLCGWPGRGNAVFQAALRLATPLISRVHAGRCYRSIVWVEPAEGDREAA